MHSTPEPYRLDAMEVATGLSDVSENLSKFSRNDKNFIAAEDASTRERIRLLCNLMEPLGYAEGRQNFLARKKRRLNISWRYKKFHPIDYLVTCHTDYCAGTGAVDNASGAGVMAAVASKCREEGIDNVAFIAFDAEEQGLKGSGAVLAAYRKEIQKYDPLVINVDSIGEGKLVQLRSSLIRKREILLPIDQWESSQHRTDADSFLSAGFSAATISSYNARRRVIASICFYEEVTPEFLKALESFSVGNVCNTEEDTAEELNEANMDAAAELVMEMICTNREKLTILEQG